jgi:hypothetical protein
VLLPHCNTQNRGSEGKRLPQRHPQRNSPVAFSSRQPQGHFTSQQVTGLFLAVTVSHSLWLAEYLPINGKATCRLAWLVTRHHDWCLFYLLNFSPEAPRRSRKCLIESSPG